MNNMRTENWCGYEIRFVEINGEWYALLKDICDALHLRTDTVAQRLQPDMLERIKVDLSDPVSTGVKSLEPRSISKVTKDLLNKDTTRKRGQAKTRWMLAVNEIGIYEALFASRRLEARKFRLWSAKVMQKLRNSIGLQQYEVLKMTDPEVQDEIDWILDSLYWDPERKCVMQSVTIQGGDVDQVVFCK